MAREAADEVGRLGARIVVEHLNDRDVAEPLVPTPAAAGAFVRSVRHDRVSVLLDAYHAARAGLDPVTEAAELGPLIGHAQFADHPGRGAPGTGELDLRAFIDALERERRARDDEGAPPGGRDPRREGATLSARVPVTWSSAAGPIRLDHVATRCPIG